MMQKLSPDSILVARSDVRHRRVLDEAVVIRQQSAETLVLNEVAITVLECCDGQRSLGQISEQIEAEFDAGLDTIQHDVLAFARELLDAGLVDLEAPA